MAFPQVASTSAGDSGANATTHTITLPSGYNTAGDLLLVFFASDGAVTASVTTPASGWSSVYGPVYGNSSTNTVVGYLFWRVADGGESSTITITTSASEGTAYACYRVTGHDVPTTAIEATTHNTTGASTAPNPPSETASWGSDDNLWIAAYWWDGNITHTSFPANYTSNQLHDRWANTGSGSIAIASDEVATATEDPGAGAISGSDQWASATVVIRPLQATDVTVTPTTATLTTAPFAPTVTASDHKTATPTTASLTLSPFAPSVTQGLNVVPTTASLTLTTFAPTVSTSNHQLVTPTTTALTLATFAPTAVNPVTVTPTTSALSLSPFGPTVTASDHQSVTPTTTALTLTTYAPVVTAVFDTRVTPTTASLATETFAPTVSTTAHVTVTPTTLSLAMTSFAPTASVTDHKVVTPSLAELSLTAFNPDVVASDHQLVTAATAALVTASFAPTVRVAGLGAEGDLTLSMGGTSLHLHVGGTQQVSGSVGTVGLGARSGPTVVVRLAD
jgi:hypothetical protein